jgi:hypothetical protein
MHDVYAQNVELTLNKSILKTPHSYLVIKFIESFRLSYSREQKIVFK